MLITPVLSVVMPDAAEDFVVAGLRGSGASFEAKHGGRAEVVDADAGRGRSRAK